MYTLLILYSISIFLLVVQLINTTPLSLVLYVSFVNDIEPSMVNIIIGLVLFIIASMHFYYNKKIYAYSFVCIMLVLSLSELLFTVESLCNNVVHSNSFWLFNVTAVLIIIKTIYLKPEGGQAEHQQGRGALQ